MVRMRLLVNENRARTNGGWVMSFNRRGRLICRKIDSMDSSMCMMIVRRRGHQITRGGGVVWRASGWR